MAFVNLGTDHDTGEFAVESLRCWWNHVGKRNFTNVKKLLINKYEKGIKVTDEEIQSIDVEKVGPYGDFSYIIRGFKR